MLVFVIVRSVAAYTFDNVAIEYWAGSGSNEAVVVIDFGDDSYAFGYRWAVGPKYGKDLMDAVNAAGALDYTETGGLLNTISYGSYVNVGQAGWPTDWWSYFTSSDGENWESAAVGFAERELSNGSWDGWAHQTMGAWPPAHLPTTPIRQIQPPVEYDANDFAAEVTEYIQGDGVGNDPLSGQPFNDANCALGRPTLITTGDGWLIPPEVNVPVVPVYQAFRAFEVVTIGNGGRLTVKFNHRVANDKNNPYGIDFIIYGNTTQVIGPGQSWTNENPEEVTVGDSAFAEPGVVAVSQNGNDWYYFSSGPFADDFAPTASYEWDDVNDVWGRELNPTRPIDPNLTAADFAGQTVAQMIAAYNGSAGGTGFDIAELGLDWIMYVRIEDDPESSVTTEIDAIADVSCCGDYKHPYPLGDINQDCKVNMQDFALLAGNWLDCTWDCE